MIVRERYLNWLIRNKNTSLIKVISGVRRSGKSTLFELYKEYLKQNGVEESQLIHLNFEDLRYIEQRDYLKLNDYILNLTKDSRQYYIFLDEIQHVKKFEEVVNSLNLQSNLDLYITGSNAYFMSGELATLLAGRYSELRILPLSFKEFQSEFSYLSLEDVYEKYVQTAFPYLVHIDNTEDRVNYIQGTYNDIVLKDIITRYNITDQDVLERILIYLASVIGSEVSINKIANVLKQDISISNNTVERYVDALVSGLILYKAPRYDIKGKNLLRRLEKYYLVDMGFRELVLPDAQQDWGHVLENVIYLELKRRHNTVYVGKHDKYEVDFVGIDFGAKPTYYQVSLQTLDEETLKRELRSLEVIKDDYPKYLLTLDTFNKEANYNGIIKMNALDWLMQ